ncbi:MAG TPA: cytochrome c peroxidase [Bacteroidia bacterium]|nr:cytochrome c peroxidase [Bacteroidia bacterium]
MKNRKTAIVIFFAGIVALLLSFSPGNDYFAITAKDVELKIPKGFPKPGYDFKKNPLTPEKFVLGRKLFYDPILSLDSTISCASCHQRIAAFAHIDHPISHGIYGLFGKRNVPALQNLIWKDAFMADGGVNNLEVQPVNPITNPVEMNESLAHVVMKLKRNPVYVQLFATAYGDTLINSEHILKALAQFTGLMISADSRYDKFTRGEDTLSAAEMRGLKLFRAKCADCHREPLFTDNSYSSNGIAPDTSLHDAGRMAITGVASDEYKYKVPSLRNIAMTYPYMHDGRFRSLQQVLDFYAAGKYFTANADPRLKKSAGMTSDEKSDIIAFLQTLTDKTFLYDRRFADPNMQ